MNLNKKTISNTIPPKILKISSKVSAKVNIIFIKNWKLS